MLFSTLDTFLILWSCRLLKEIAFKSDSVSVYYTVEMTPNKDGMAVNSNTSQVKRIECAVTVKKKVMFAAQITPVNV